MEIMCDSFEYEKENSKFFYYFNLFYVLKRISALNLMKKKLDFTLRKIKKMFLKIYLAEFSQFSR